MAAPNSTDLQNLLSAAGLWNSSYATIASAYITGAIQQWQVDTGRNPFICGASDSTIRVNPPGDTSQGAYNLARGGEKILELPVPFVSISSINTGVSADFAGASVDLLRSVEFGPALYDVKGLPIEWVRFTYIVWGGTNSISITGKPGSYSDWPQDAKDAVVAMAGAKLLATVIGNLTGGINSWTEADVKEDYGSGATFKAIADVWRSMYSDAVNRYRFVRVGL